MSGPRRVSKTHVELLLRLTRLEKTMLRTLSVRSAEGSEQGVVRRLIRDAWHARRRDRRRKVP